MDHKFDRTYIQRSGYRQLPLKPAPKKPKRHFKSYAFLVTLALVLGLGVYGVGIRHAAANEQAKVAAAQVAERKTVARAKLSNEINKIINQNSGITFSISAIDLSDGTHQQFGPAGPMQAASVGKLITAALYLHLVQTGQASMNTTINGYSARYELQQMIQQSDDNAWAAFNDYLGHPALANYAQQIGINSYDPNDDTISAADISLLLQKLYQGELLRPTYTNLLLSFMQNTNYEQFIPPAVPDGDSIYHKVGLIDDNVNDAAIITNGKQAMILTIFTDGNGTYDWGTRAALMQQITKLVMAADL